MKKITLLFMILCAGQLYGMEKPKADYMASLPREVQGLIIAALSSGNNIDETISAIKATSLTNQALNQIVSKEYGDVSDLKGFTALVSVLAEKFPDLTRREIAEKFGTPIAKEYVRVNFTLLFAIGYSSPIEEITPLVNQGADVNFYVSQSTFGPCTLLTLAVNVARVDIVKLLLDSGANPSFKLPINGMTALDIVLDLLNQVRDKDSVEKLTAIKTLLEEAMMKKQQ